MVFLHKTLFHCHQQQKLAVDLGYFCKLQCGKGRVILIEKVLFL